MNDARHMDRVRLAGQSGEHRVGEDAINANDARVAKLKEYIKLQDEERAQVMLAINEDQKVVAWALTLLITSKGNKDHSFDGWYLMGVMVHPDFRRQGIARQLTRRRIRWLESRTRKVRYFTHEDNDIARALHDKFDFKAVCLVDEIAGIKFGKDERMVFELDISKRTRTASSQAPVQARPKRPKSSRNQT
jgi:ribosomal protein S18 acetylase RimI-like enzyme